MKTLILMRHGNAAQAYDDFSRQLTTAGRMHATETAQRISATGLSIGTIISSDALRAKTTAEIVSKELGGVGIVERHFLYADYTTDELTMLLAEVGDQGDSMESIVVVGHNPNISYNACNLIGSRSVCFAPAEAVGIAFDVDKWSDVSPMTGKLAFSFQHNLL